MNKNQKIKKRVDFGYIQSQKKKRTIYTILALIPPLTVFFVGWIINKDRNTVFTVFAAVGCLPACKFAVSAIMMYLQSQCQRTIISRLSSIKKVWCVRMNCRFLLMKNRPF